MAVTTDPGIDLPDEAAGLIEALAAAQQVKAQILAQAAPYDELIESLTERIQSLLGDAEVGRLGGVERVKWTRVLKFDAAKFKANEPEIATEFLKEPEVNVSWLKRQRPDLHFKYSDPGTTRRFSIVDGDA